MLILSCYFIIFGIVTLINLSFTITTADVVFDRLLDYFACQAKGHSANNTCSAEYDELESHLKPKLNTAAYFLMGLVPWTNLLFAIQVSDIKKAVQKIKRTLYHRGSQK